MTRKARFILLTAAGIVILVLVVLLLLNRDGRGGQYRVGVMMPLTGGAASLGTSCRNGIQMAMEEYNAARAPGEPEIDLLFEDTKADPTTGVSAFHKLTSAHRVRVIIGPLASGVALALAPLAEKSHTVVLSPGASAPSISTAGDYIFRNELSEAFGAREQADLAFERLDFRAVALLYVNNAYGTGTASMFRNRFLELGGRIPLDEAFNPGTTDFRTVLTALRNAKPDAVLFVYQDEILNFMRQRAELAIETLVFTTPVFESPSNLDALGTLAQGVIYAYYGEFDPAAESGATVSFLSNYRRRYGESPSYYSALGYDAVRIVIDAFRRSDFSSDRVKDSLYTIQNFPGVTGSTSFDRNGDVQKPVTLRTVRGGRFVRY